MNFDRFEPTFQLIIHIFTSDTQAKQYQNKSKHIKTSTQSICGQNETQIHHKLNNQQLKTTQT
jgi:hypothetical protein